MFPYSQSHGYLNLETMLRNNSQTIFLQFMFSKKIASFLALLAFLGLYSCIEEFYPHIDGKDSNKIFIYGQVTDNEGYQYISISSTSTINNPQELPISGCNVTIEDDLGHTFTLEEYEEGKYRVWIAKEFLQTNTSYRARVITSSGEEIMSDFDKMPSCPEIDSLYYRRIDKPTGIVDSFNKGIQFYVDFNTSGNHSKYYRWEIEETWEHHASMPIKVYWDGYKVVKPVPEDYSHFTCWTTKNINELFSFTTKNLNPGKITAIPLNFVNAKTQRLTYCYSVLVKQYALSETSYRFWEELKQNNVSGGMSSKQPINVKGNIKSITNPDKKVLGIFQATAIKTKRIFAQNITGLYLTYPTCVLPTPYTKPAKFPLPRFTIYLYGESALYTIDASCVLCDFPEGTTTKPDFWPY